MKGKILKITIASMLLITLTAINFVSVGVGLASYAEDNITAKTTHENVAFTTYFKDEVGAKLSNTKVDINSQEIKLYLNVGVAKEGYFNGQVKLKDSNFKFVSSQSEYVNTVTEDTVVLNQINAGASPEIEVIVKPKIEGTFNLDLLNMESKVSLTGVYKDRTEKDINISGEAKVQIAYVSTNAQESIKNSIDVLTNKVGVYNGEEKRIVQVLLKTGMENNNYPVKHITSKVNIPEINGKKPTLESKVTLKGMSKYNVNNENNIVTVDIENEADAENKVMWTKEGNEEIILTYIYDKDTVVTNTEITANNVITLHDGQVITAPAITTLVNEEKDGLVTLKEIVEPEIYKGKIYAGVDKEFVNGTEIQVNSNKAVETIYVNEKPTSIPSEYVRTTINKKELISLLGENGTLEINAGSEKYVLTKASETDEKGNVVIVYPQGINSITIRTTTPQNSGNLLLNHVKTIRATNKALVKRATQMETSVNGTYETRSTQKGIVSETTEITQLKETVTSAKLEVNRESLSTITENKNVEIKATLLSNNEQYDLYSNPTIEIELPQDVVNAKVNSINKIYGDEFTEIRPAQAVVNGKQVIRIQLKGTQETYKEPGIEGTQIIINADLTLNNKATNKQDVIKMTYTNANANQYKDSATVGTETVNMEIVSPKGLITTNDINVLGVQTTGDEEKVTTTLDKNVGAKQVKVEAEVINNNEAPVNDVAILGKFGVDGEQNNLHATLSSGLTVEGTDASKTKVYYTENESATADLENSENAWQETATTTAKKYLVKLADIQVAEGMKMSYDMQIPEGLDYNQKAEEGYEATYVESNTGVSQGIKATTIELTTGEEPVKENEQTENQNGEKAPEGDIEVSVYQEEVGGAIPPVMENEQVTYTTIVKNLTAQEQKNVKLSWKIPEGFEIETQKLMPQEVHENLKNIKYNIPTETIQTLDNSKDVTIQSIPAGQYVAVSIVIVPKSINKIEQEFTISVEVQDANKKYNSNEIKGKILGVSQCAINLTANKENEYVKTGDVIEYTIKVKNENTMQKASLIQDKIPTKLSITGVTVGEEQIEIPTDNNIEIPITMAAGEEKEIKIATIVNYEENKQKEEKITNKALMTINAAEQKASNEVSHTIMSENSQKEEGNEFVDKDGNKINTYKISGVAWEDEDKNGQRDDQEKTMSGINVQLLNVQTNELATNPNGQKITATTIDNGEYTLTGIQPGQYIVVFEYDASTYRITDYEKEGVDESRNSNAITEKLSIEGEEKTYGVTDIISIQENGMSNTNIGLVKSEKFDMKLEKFISKVVVQTSSGTKQYDYNNESLAKVEIPAKEINGANVVIEYKIKVTNGGELEGYIKNIVDYLPNDLTFSSELNKDWYKEGTNIYNNSLANKKLTPGESKEVTLTVTKKMTEDNTGLTNNLAEIKEDYNASGVTDINSTPANKKQGENDLGSADIILSIRTGGPVLYTTLAIIILAVIAIGTYFVKREAKPKKDEII